MSANSEIRKTVLENVRVGFQQNADAYGKFLSSAYSIILSQSAMLDTYEAVLEDFCDRFENGENPAVMTYERFCDMLGRENKVNN